MELLAEGEITLQGMLAARERDGQARSEDRAALVAAWRSELARYRAEAELQSEARIARGCSGAGTTAGNGAEATRTSGCRRPLRRARTRRHSRHGGDDTAENLTALCVWCHLEGVHGGRIRALPPASAIRWTMGARPILAVHGRRKVERPTPGLPTWRRSEAARRDWAAQVISATGSHGR